MRETQANQVCAAERSRPGTAIATQLRVRRESRSQLVRDAIHDHPGAKSRLVETFTPLIGSVARLYAGVPGVGRPELMQEGVVGLLRALERFDPEQGTPFWAYASWWVRQAMQQVVAELSRPVVLSDRALRQLARVRAARRAFVRANSREPSIRELVETSCVPLDQLQRLTVADRQPRGLEERFDEESGEGATFGDALADERAEEAYERLAVRLDAQAVPGLLERLDARERRVVAGRFGFGGGECTLRQLGDELGVSPERVRQLERRALEELRAAYFERSVASPEALAS